MTILCALFLLLFLQGLRASALPPGPGPGYYATDDCQVIAEQSSKLVNIFCRIRTINSEIDATNFSSISTNQVSKLRIECNDVVFLISSLRNLEFSQLIELQTLEIENCKISDIPSEAFSGLLKLKILKIRTHNSVWSAMSLRISVDAFHDQIRLQSLDLNDNNIWTLPPDLFCSLETLQSLNLANNKLSYTSVLGFNQQYQQCVPELRVLDISHNQLTNLPDYAFASLKNLQNLTISFNSINRMDDRALFGMYSLEFLDFSSNQLTSLAPELFQENKRLHTIQLSNNSLTVLAPGLFSGLSRLLNLNLSRNSLTNTWVNSETFHNLRSLASLDLSGNKLTRLDTATFRDLTNVQFLSLERNNIEQIADASFSQLSRLLTLILSHNKLKLITDKMLAGLNLLRVLRLSSNSLLNIDKYVLPNSSMLEELYLNSNKLQDVPTLVKTTVSLKTLDLSENEISVLNNYTLSNLKYLQILRVASNAIVNITNFTFSKLETLQELTLFRNKIRNVENDAFKNNSRLVAIRLDDNYLHDVGDLFANLQNLKWLNLSKNNIEILDYSSIPNGLLYLDIRNNQIRELGNYLGFGSDWAIKVIDVSFNNLVDVNARTLPDSVEIVFLNNNKISQIQPYTFFKKVNLTRVDLFGNQIHRLSHNTLRLPPREVARHLPEFHLAENPFDCDCSMQWLQTINILQESHLHPRIVDLEAVRCHLMNAKTVTSVALVDVDKQQFVCSYETHCFPTCYCCDYDACDCEMSCPVNCSCFHDDTWLTNIVDCSSKILPEVPHKIPMDATSIYLDGNRIPVLFSHILLGHKSLRVLYLNNSDIEIIQNRTFSGLRLLQSLYLQNNKLKSLKGHEFEHLTFLWELHLENNQLVTMHNATFTYLISLKILKLSGNRFVHLPVNYFSHNRQLQLIDFGLNPWFCTCEELEEMNAFIASLNKVVSDIADVQCTRENTNKYSATSEKQFNISMCSNISQSVTLKQEVNENYIYAPSIIFGVFTVTIISILVVFSNRNRLRVWAHSKYGFRIFHRQAIEDEKNNPYDAFVSYSAKDEVFVTQILAPELERGSPRYRLCLHHRDFPVGAYVSDTIVSAVDSSKRTILILSENFLKSEWNRFDFRSAHHEVLKDRRRRIIVILLGEVPRRDLDPDIRLYIKTNTFLKWGDSRFWDKLKFALPDVHICSPECVTFRKNVHPNAFQTYMNE